MVRGRTDTRDRILAGVRIEPLSESVAKLAGEALGAVKGATPIDAMVMASAAQRGDLVYTADVADLTGLRLFSGRSRARNWLSLGCARGDRAVSRLASDREGLVLVGTKIRGRSEYAPDLLPIGLRHVNAVARCRLFCRTREQRASARQDDFAEPALQDFGALAVGEAPVSAQHFGMR